MNIENSDQYDINLLINEYLAKYQRISMILMKCGYCDNGG